MKPDCSVDRIVKMKRDMEGNFLVSVPGLAAGALYSYILNDKEERPDPASRLQPHGVHGPSMTLDLGKVPRRENSWRNPPLKDYIIYELHTGTFTPEGTFDAAAERIPYLKELGVTAIELMPVAQFPGTRNWGYDGVYPYAAQSSYGGPEGLARLIDALHEAGLAAVLDVVYNHLGPEGNYLRSFGPYFTDRYQTPWGEAINFDGEGSRGVRDFFINNSLYWLFELGFDALRLDAVHGIFDNSHVHILREMKDRISAQPGGEVKYLIAESDLNDTCLVDRPQNGGYGLDAQWSDDFHHSLHTLLTGESNGYYMDFGSTGDMAKAYGEGFVYTGQHSRFRGRMHGTPSAHVHPCRLVVDSQTHDQVGNRMMGDRLSSSLPLHKLRFAAAATLLSPYIPLLFMGEEYAEPAPFQYFVSHSDPELIAAVTKGRTQEFSAFAWKGTPPDPSEESTFIRSKLGASLFENEPHAGILEFYKKLIDLRKQHPALGCRSREHMEVLHMQESNTIILGLLDETGRSSVLEALCFEETGEVKIAVPQGGRWPEHGSWKRLIDTSFNETAEMSAKIGGNITLAPMSLSLFEHIK